MLPNDGGGSDANVKADKLCTASQSPKRIAGKYSEPANLGVLAMRWVKFFLYLYVAQAAVGAAIGFAIPFVHLIQG